MVICDNSRLTDPIGGCVMVAAVCPLGDCLVLQNVTNKIVVFVKLREVIMPSVLNANERDLMWI